MTEPFYVGVIAGCGWGLFAGAFLGVLWFTRIIREMDDDEKKEAK